MSAGLVTRIFLSCAAKIKMTRLKRGISVRDVDGSEPIARLEEDVPEIVVGVVTARFRDFVDDLLGSAEYSLLANNAEVSLVQTEVSDDGIPPRPAICISI